MSAASEALAAAVAEERAAVVATLIRVTGDWDLAEDCVQDATAAALAHWPTDGVPRSPAAWLTTAARNRAIDVLRRRSTERAKLQELALAELSRPATGGEADPARDAMSDDRLRLIFTCCHPALSLESRVALTLRTVAGLSTAEIARGFLLEEGALSQRLRRAKQKIATAGIPYRVPPDDLLDERVSGVLAVIYLVFNQGYDDPEAHVADEALRLARLVVDLMPTEDEARGLLALILLQSARRPGRFGPSGELVPMEEQDRGLWDDVLAEEGRSHLRRAAASSKPPGPYRLQAEIIACHVAAGDADSTDWAAIVRWYDVLLLAQPSPVVALNRAVAIGFRDGYEAGLAALEALDAPELRGYYLLPAARADFLRRLGRRAEARAAYETAYEQAPEGSAQDLLRRRLAELWDTS